MERLEKHLCLGLFFGKIWGKIWIIKKHFRSRYSWIQWRRGTLHGVFHKRHPKAFEASSVIIFRCIPSTYPCTSVGWLVAKASSFFFTQLYSHWCREVRWTIGNFGLGIFGLKLGLKNFGKSSWASKLSKTSDHDMIHDQKLWYMINRLSWQWSMFTVRLPHLLTCCKGAGGGWHGGGWWGILSGCWPIKTYFLHIFLLTVFFAHSAEVHNLHAF